MTRVICLAFLAPETTRAMMQGASTDRSDSDAAGKLSSQDPCKLAGANRIHFVRKNPHQIPNLRVTGSNHIGVASFQRVPGGE